ncbi:hypothetical protein [Nostoc sp.]
MCREGNLNREARSFGSLVEFKTRPIAKSLADKPTLVLNLPNAGDRAILKNELSNMQN